MDAVVQEAKRSRLGRARSVVWLALIATAILMLDIAAARADCVQQCSEYRYNDLAKLRMCRPFGDWDERCQEPWVLTLLKADGTRFRGLGEIEDISVQPTQSASWIFAARPENKNLENPASSANQTYVVYDLKSETYEYEGNEFGKAEFEWENKNGVPHPNGCFDDPQARFPVLIGPYSVDDRHDVFPPTQQTRLGQLLSLAIFVAAFSTVVIGLIIACFVACFVVVRALRALGRRSSLPDVR